MSQIDYLTEMLTCRLDFARKTVEPCTIVIFGASGDLTARKLIPALYHLYLENQMPKPFRIVGFARREKTDAAFRDELKTALQQFSRTKPVDDTNWEKFAESLFYCQGEFSDANAYTKLAKMLAGFGDPALRNKVLFYLSISPTQFAEVVGHLSQATLLRREEAASAWQR